MGKVCMQKDIDMIDAEELFDDMEKVGKVPVQKSKDRRKRSPKNFFAEIKIKMVMRIYGVSRVQALEIIASRESARKAAEKAESSSANDESIDAATLFGA